LSTIWSPSVGWLSHHRQLLSGRGRVHDLDIESDVPDGIAEDGAQQISAFVLAVSARRNSGSISDETTGLRALVRWLHLEGYTPLLLAGAAPTAPGLAR
jgi:hypothetical protein